jgi:hypothetical protein
MPPDHRYPAALDMPTASSRRPHADRQKPP